MGLGRLVCDGIAVHPCKLFLGFNAVLLVILLLNAFARPQCVQIGALERAGPAPTRFQEFHMRHCN